MAVMLMTLAASCNLGVRRPPANPKDAASTIVAMTLSAQGLPTSSGYVASPLPSPPPATPTTRPTLYINANNAKCRGGPSTDFKVLATYTSGTVVDLIAKDTTNGYWIVKDPSSADICWVQASDATPGGSFESLPEITPQASTALLPSAPTIFYPNYTCEATGSSSTLTTNLTWNDNADNENGYRLYRNGTQIADLAANSTTFSETIDFVLGTQETYAVEAYNDAGASPQKTLSFKCP